MFSFAASFIFSKIFHCSSSAAVVSWLLVLISVFAAGIGPLIVLIMNRRTLAQDLEMMKIASFIAATSSD